MFGIYPMVYEVQKSKYYIKYSLKLVVSDISRHKGEI